MILDSRNGLKSINTIKEKDYEVDGIDVFSGMALEKLVGLELLEKVEIDLKSKADAIGEGVEIQKVAIKTKLH